MSDRPVQNALHLEDGRAKIIVAAGDRMAGGFDLRSRCPVHHLRHFMLNVGPGAFAESLRLGGPILGDEDIAFVEYKASSEFPPRLFIPDELIDEILMERRL